MINQWCCSNQLDADRRGGKRRGNRLACKRGRVYGRAVCCVFQEVGHLPRQKTKIVNERNANCITPRCASSS